MVLNLQPIDYQEACRFIKATHRHHLPPQGWKFGIGLNDGEKVVGVVTVGRPIARHLDNGLTLEVTRCCTDGSKNACSMLYGAAWKVTKNLGYKKLITYTIPSESKSSLKGAGWKVLNEKAGGQSWNRSKRFRIDKTEISQRILWEAD